MAKGRKPKGLGDVIDNITEATGVKALVNVVSKALDVDCGCEKRKEYLNKKFKFNCLSDEEIAKWKLFKEADKKVLTMEDQLLICDLLKSGYNMSVQPCSSCGASNYIRWIQMIDDITL